jgi:acyl carrier protein
MLEDRGNQETPMIADSHIVRTKVTHFIFDKFPLARKRQLNDDASLLETGIVDSIGILEIVTFLEQEFAVRVEDDDLVPENLGTIANITSFVTRKSDGRPKDSEAVRANA